FSSRRRHTRWPRDWSSDVCSSDLGKLVCGTLRALDEQVAAGRPLEHHDISSAFELANKEVRQHSTHVGAVLADLHRDVIALDEDVVVNDGNASCKGFLSDGNQSLSIGRCQ